MLYLPFDLVESFSLRRVIAAHAQTWSDGYAWLEQFELRSQERAFARQMLSRKRNVWLFRCNQRQRCGDFITVDMSDPLPAARRVNVIELKQNQPLSFGSGSDLQRSFWRRATAEIEAEHGIIDAESPVSFPGGGESEVLSHLLGTPGPVG